MIDDKVITHGLKVLSIDETKVSVQALMLDAAYRRPPFSEGEKEKGFRDSLAAEAFIQLIEQSPSDPNACLSVLLTNDKLLSEAVMKRTANVRNVKVLASLEELKSLINTIASQVDEQFVAEID